MYQKSDMGLIGFSGIRIIRRVLMVIWLGLVVPNCEYSPVSDFFAGDDLLESWLHARFLRQEMDLGSN